MSVRVGDIVKIRKDTLIPVLEETLDHNQMFEAKVISIAEGELYDVFTIQVKLPNLQVYDTEVTPLARRARSQ